MRIRKLKNCSGNIVILMVILIPVMFAMLAIIIDVGQILYSRTRLEIAADRSVFAGAESMVDTLNRIAAENWDIHKAWRDLVDDYGENTQQNEQKRKEAEKTYEAKFAQAITNIENEKNEMSNRAQFIALQLLSHNLPSSEGKITGRFDINLSKNADANQEGHVRFGEVSGPTFIDPNSVKEGGYSGTRYLIKSKDPGNTIAIFATKTIRPMFFNRLLPDGVKIHATSAAQAFGGSIEDFARKETGTVKDAEAMVDDDGYDALYHATIVPMWSAGIADEGMRH